MHIPSSHRRLFAAASVAVSLLLAPALKADPLLSAAYEAQLEAWLGQGNLTFTNVFTKTTGSTTNDFHGAADGKGATFTLMSISGRGQHAASLDLTSQIIGGYNPQSWSTSSGYNYTSTDAERTAFIYNLTVGSIQRQRLTSELYFGSDVGAYQTYNYSGYGPTFGGGHDINVEDTYLNYGYAQNFSYGGTAFGDEIISGGPNYSTYSSFDVGALEVWTFAPATNSVPDTAGTLGLLSVSLLAIAACRRRVA